MSTTRSILLAVVACAGLLVACGGGGDGDGSASVNAPGGGSPGSATAPSIFGAPTPNVAAGQSYSFTPQASDPNGDRLTFSVENKPGWAAFDTTTGRLAGTPASADIGTYAHVTIRVSDGREGAELPAFTITVTGASAGSASLSWVPPTEREDGSALTNLAGYRVYYGQLASALDRQIRVDNPGLSAYVVENLGTGTWFFAVSAVDAAGLESRLSITVSKSIG
jgi:hypothetical protein